MSQQHETVIEFGAFRLDPVKRLLMRDGEPVALTSKCLDTLLVLIEHRGEVVSKDALIAALWPDTIVEENNLTQQISMLRKALGERVGEHRYVVTVPGRGYSFVAEVRTPNDVATDSIAEQQTTQSIARVGDYDALLDSKDATNYLQARPSASHRRWSSKAFVLSIPLILIGFVALLALGLSSHKAQPAKSGEAKRSIAVLPFKSLNSDPANDYLSAGMADTLIARLSNLHQISVRPTSAVMKYARQSQDAQAIGRALGVDSVLEGTIQKSGDRVRVTVQLVSVQDEAPLWAESFDEKMTDIFSVQDAISERVAQTMRVKMSGEDRKQLKKRGTENVEAYQEYMRGRFFWNKRSEEGLRRSTEHFQRAIDLDSNYAQAYAGLADAYALLAYYKAKSVADDEAFGKAKQAALKALVLDDALAEAHTSLALIKTCYDRDDAASESEYRRAIELNPNYATAHHWYSELLMGLGRMQESMSEITRAQELDPLSPIINTSLGERLYYLRRYDEAVKQLRYTLDIEPGFAQAHFALGLALEQKGSYAEAVLELRRATELAINRNTVASLAHAYALMGEKSAARKILEELKSAQGCDPYGVAVIYAGLGDRKQAFDWLQQVKDKKSFSGALLKIDPRLDELRTDPKFQEIL